MASAPVAGKPTRYQEACHCPAGQAFDQQRQERWQPRQLRGDA